MVALVNKVIPFSAVDGPGNRTSVFLQGCNMDCRYCHNPETRKVCVHCGACVEVCPAGALSWKELPEGRRRVAYDMEKCVLCDACIHVCTHGASPRIRELTPKETFREIARQIPFIRGVTVSGGECTLYPEFLTELFAICKENGLDTLLDSNGTLDFSRYPDLLAVTDGVMLDIKAFDPREHETVTGAGNELVFQNARYLAERGKLHEVRTVVVPGLFDAEGTIRSTAAMLRPYLPIRQIQYKIIAYRPMGVRKEYASYPVPGSQLLSHLAKAAKEEGMERVVVI